MPDCTRALSGRRSRSVRGKNYGSGNTPTTKTPCSRLGCPADRSRCQSRVRFMREGIWRVVPGWRSRTVGLQQNIKQALWRKLDSGVSCRGWLVHVGFNMLGDSRCASLVFSPFSFLCNFSKSPLKYTLCFGRKEKGRLTPLRLSPRPHRLLLFPGLKRQHSENPNDTRHV